MAGKVVTPEKLFGALADETRRRILHLIGDREVCVCFFVEALDVPQPKISRHLAYLRRSGLVEARREGKWMHYRIARLDPRARAILDDALAWTEELPQGRRDRTRFAAACCDRGRFASLQSAPTPSAVAAGRRC